MKILCFIQYEDNTINGVSKEALSLSQEIAANSGAELSLLTFSQSAAEELKSYTSNEILLAKDDNLNDYNPLFYTAAVEKVMSENSFDLLILAHTYQARDWVPRLSARCNIPFISDCIDYSIEGDDIDWVRSLYRAKINCKVKATSNKSIISVQSGCFKADNLNKGNSAINEIEIDLSSVQKTIVPGEKFKESGSQIDLNSSDVIVAIGRGIAKEENIPLATDLSSSLGGLLASSRPVVDSGWLDHSLQIGSSGQVVSPKLYLALGISGAIQHVVGMKGSKCIISVNKDPNAPIFELSDYGIVGDILEIIPKLNEAIKNS
jgi:electron transfer flavoprotein alpha subunit|tara:strand:- start:551 stop:1510 length:960 start_codon:yes stop_codon:yes gene_type:complete